jgi:hypothetical protein
METAESVRNSALGMKRQVLEAVQTTAWNQALDQVMTPVGRRILPLQRQIQDQLREELA